MSDTRLDRLESKVDKIQDQVSELQVDLKVHMKLVEEHVTGDKKIINEIQPMIQDYYFEKQQKARRAESLKKAGILAAIVSAASAILTKLVFFINN